MHNKSNTKELVINTIIFGFSTLGAKVIMFIILPIYTAYMSAGELGEGELVVNLMNLIYPIATINIISSLLRFSMEEKNDKKTVLQNTLIIVIVGICIAGVLIFTININSSILKWRLYLWILLICYSLQQILSVFSKALDKTKTFAIANIIYTLSLLFISLVLLVWLHRGTAGYLEGIILSNIVSFLYLVYTLKINKYLYFGKIDLKLLKEMVVFSFPLILNSISWWIASFCDRFVLETSLGTQAVGIYSVSSKIPAIVSTVAAIFMQAWVLSSIKAYENGDTVFFDKVFKKFSALFISWATIIITISKFIMPFLASNEFGESWKYVPILICGAVFNGFGNFYAAFYTSAKKNFSIMITTLLGAIINIALNFWLIPIWGIQGATIATMISNFFIAVYRLVDSRRFIKFNLDLKKLIPSVFLLVIESILLVYSNKICYTIIINFVILGIYFKEILDLLFKVINSIRGVIYKWKNK